MFNQKKYRQKSGFVLVFSLYVVIFLSILSVGIGYMAAAEVAQTRRFENSTKAFWLAELALHRFLEDPTMLNSGSVVISEGEGSITLSKDDSDFYERIVTAEATVNGISKTLELSFENNPVKPLLNTLSIGGDLNVLTTSLICLIDVGGLTRVEGDYLFSAAAASCFDDFAKFQPAGDASLTYPDMNSNSTADEFDDFVLFNQAVLQNYAPSEVFHVQGNGTQNLTSATDFTGLKVVFFEGDEDRADVNITDDPIGLSTEKPLTLISTGTVTYLNSDQSPGEMFNIISWEAYNEQNNVAAQREGAIYTHGTLVYDLINPSSDTTGSVISNDNMMFGLNITSKTFTYQSLLTDGVHPAGFHRLVGNPGTAGYASLPAVWRND